VSGLPFRSWVDRFRRAANTVIHRLVWWGMSAVPPGSHTVVAGWPDTEENAIRVVMALAEMGEPRIDVLVDDVVVSRRWFEVVAGRPAPSEARYMQRRGARAVWSFVRARRAFYTHGLLGTPPPRRGRVHVNLWHGHGPKSTAPLEGGLRRPTPLLVANTLTWGREAARAQGIQPERLLHHRHPRQEAFDEPPRREALRTLGLDPDRPLVLWMPTYRQARSVSGREAWSDAGDDGSTRSMLRLVGEALIRSELDDVNLVAKIHPLDAEDGAVPGIRCLTNDDHWAAGISTYQLVAMADALVSDYSSVWVEFLELDRPLALFCPDLHFYESGRGFKSPPLPEVAGELVLSELGELVGFLEEVRVGIDSRRAARAAVKERLELAPRSTTRSLLELARQPTLTIGPREEG
jgi:CDP-glycerol glycerophosphotransferase